MAYLPNRLLVPTWQNKISKPLQMHGVCVLGELATGIISDCICVACSREANVNSIPRGLHSCPVDLGPSWLMDGKLQVIVDAVAFCQKTHRNKISQWELSNHMGL